MPTRILFLAASPTNEAQLRIGQEYKEIDEKIQAGRYRDEFQLKMGPSVSIEDIQGVLLHSDPNIVHFSGHGSQDAIVLEGRDGQAQMLSEKSLSDLLEIVNRDGSIKCVFLNACYSEDQARAISRNVDCVIGMSNAISDDAARDFATSFYQGLANGRSIRDSFDLGKNTLSSLDLPEEKVPKLLCRPAVDPGKVSFSRDQAPRGAAAVAPRHGVRRSGEDEGRGTQPPPALNLVGIWDGTGTVQMGFMQAPTARRTIFYQNGTFEESGSIGGNMYYSRGVYSFDPARNLLVIQSQGTLVPVTLFLSDVSPGSFTASWPSGTLNFRRAG